MTKKQWQYIIIVAVGVIIIYYLFFRKPTKQPREFKQIIRNNEEREAILHKPKPIFRPAPALAREHEPAFKPAPPFARKYE